MKNSKFKVLISLMMILTLLFCLMVVPSFADTSDAEDTTVETTADNTEADDTAETSADTATDTVADTATSVATDAAVAETTATDDGWVTLSTSDYIAIVIGAVLAVGFVVAIVLFVPKKTKQK